MKKRGKGASTKSIAPERFSPGLIQQALVNRDGTNRVELCLSNCLDRPLLKVVGLAGTFCLDRLPNP